MAALRRTLPLLVCFVLAACGDHERATTTPTGTGTIHQSIINGVRDTADPAVVMILMRASPTSTDVRYVCTGTIVAPHVVLTAAHCLDPRVAGDGQYGVFTGDDINDDAQANDHSKFFTAKETHFDPAFDPADHPPAGGHDLGVIITSSPLAATPIPMNVNALDASFVGTAVRVIGSGRSTPAADSSGQKLQVATKVTGIDPEHIVFEDPNSSTCEGDSGGPLLATIGANEIIIGVHSFGEHSQSCTGINYDQRVDTYVASFIAPFIKTADPNFMLVDTTVSPATVDAGSPDEPVDPETDAGTTTDAGSPPITTAPTTSTSSCSMRARSESAPISFAFALLTFLGLRRKRPVPSAL